MTKRTTVPVRDGLFTDERLVGGRCGTCGRHLFPLAATCAYCGSDEVIEVALSPTGTLWAWTAVTAPPPGYRGEVPFGFGIVELPDGIRVVTRITEADPARLAFGTPMRFVIAPLQVDDDGSTVVSYAFEPAPRP